MLQDFLTLESFYGLGGGALFMDEVMQHYGVDRVRCAVESGFLLQRVICVGPDCGRCLCWLSEEGRRVAGIN